MWSFVSEHDQASFLIVTRLILAILVATFGQMALAQADLSLEVVVSENPIRPPGSSGVVTVRLTNLGPQPVRNPASLVEIPSFGAPPVDFFSIPGEICTLAFGVLDPFNPDDPSVFVFQFGSPGLLAGDSSECRATYAVNPDLEGDITVSWVISSLSTQPVDPNTTNNSATVTFGIPLPVQVPGLNTPGAALMVFLFSLLASSIRRRGSKGIS
ncbi:MAG: hypothetical protein AAGA23_17520 [Pseudomonadota bacterium]